MQERFSNIVKNTCKLFGANSKIKIKSGYPPTVNHQANSKFAYEVAKKVVGMKASSTQIPMMGSEDFSYFLEKVPGAFAWIGNGNSAPLHNPKYDFNDSILTTGSSYLASLAEEKLNKS